MKFLTALIILLCLQTPMAHAYQQGNGEIKYNVKERLTMPQSKSSGLKAASNVVIKEVEFNSLPEFIQNQAEIISSDCTKSGENKKLIKFYRYVSDLTRDNGFSANYLADLSPLAGKPQQACMVDSACTSEGCMLVGYISTAYEKWERHFFERTKSWKYTNVEHPKTKSVLTVLDLSKACRKSGAAAAADDEPCLSRRLWLESGLREYNPNSVDSFFEQPPEEAAPAEAPDITPDEAPAEQKEAPEQPVTE